MNQYIAFAQCLVSIGIMVFIWAGPFARYRRDNFRSRIRTIRDSLFDFMWKNGCDFNNPAYRATRQSLNGTIRLSNFFSPLTYLNALVAALRIGETNKFETAESMIDKLPDGELKKMLASSLAQSRREMLIFIFINNIPGVLISLLLLFFYVCIVAWQKGRVFATSTLDRSTNMLLGDAYRFGEPNLPYSTMRHLMTR